ncbi:MAG: hypothetical protein K9G48_15455 [Reyranella sp.]|nr:hypothetical protein [Reyranella sp.]
MKSDKPIRLKVTGGPMSWDTHIVDVETGREIAGVIAYSINARAGKEPATLSIELFGFDCDLEAQATAKRFGLPPVMIPDMILGRLLLRLMEVPVVVYAAPAAFVALGLSWVLA